jgi:hypothetical protein
VSREPVPVIEKRKRGKTVDKIATESQSAKEKREFPLTCSGKTVSGKIEDPVHNRASV